MIKKEGFICIGENLQTYLSIIYGTNKDRITPVPFSTNLIPFQTFKTAENARRKLELTFQKQFERVIVAKLEMQIAESEEEFSLLQPRDLVVIARNEILGEIEHRIYGDLRKGAAQPGEPISQNGLKMYQSMKRPLDMIFQMNRQAEMSATIANFHIEYLD